MSSVTHPLQHFSLEEHDGKVSIGGRTTINLHFANDTDALAEEEQEQEAQTESSEKTCTKYEMEITAEKNQTNDNRRQWHPERDQG